MIDVILVGLGARGRFMLEFDIFNAPRFRLVAGVDPSEDAREQTKLMAPELPIMDDYERALGEVKADAVYVLSPAPLHYEHVKAAIEAGKHVLVEKPFADSHSRAVELTRLAKQRGVKLMVGQNFRYVPLVVALCQELKDGTLGELGYFSLTHNRYRPVARNLAGVPHAWLAENAIHDWDQLLAIVQRRPIRVYAKSFDTSWSDYKQGAAHALIEFEGGFQALLEGSFIALATDYRLHLETERGMVIAESLNAYRVVSPEGTRTIEMPEDPDAQTLSTGRVAQAFADYIDNDIEPSCSGQNNLRTMQLVWAAIRSAETGQPVDIPESPEEPID